MRLPSPGPPLVSLIVVIPTLAPASVAMLTLYVPTAQASVGDTAATPRRPFTERLQVIHMLGLGMMLHWVPSQCSASVNPLLSRLYIPTTHTSFHAVAETE